VRILKAHGAEIHINPFFVLVLLMYASVGLFLETIFAFWVVLLHELAHVVVARGLGYKVERIEMLPFGGVVQFDKPFDGTRRSEIAIALAGPVHNFIFAGLAFVLLGKEIVPPGFGKFIFELNLAMGLFNLLPAIPLDGGRVARAVLSDSIGMERATHVAVNIGRVLGFFILILGIYLVFAGRGNIFLPSLGGFLMFAASRESEKVSYLRIKDSLRKKERLISEGSMYAEIIVSYEESPLVEVVRKFAPGKVSIVMVLDSNLNIIGLITEAAVFEGMARYGPRAPIRRIVR
jgi:stage IV sporulation protein FB